MGEADNLLFSNNNSKQVHTNPLTFHKFWLPCAGNTHATYMCILLNMQIFPPNVTVGWKKLFLQFSESSFFFLYNISAFPFGLCLNFLFSSNSSFFDSLPLVC